MAEKKGNTIGAFALEVKTMENSIRVFAEHPGQRFSISIVPMNVAKEFPDRPIKPNVEFDFQNVMKLAADSFTGAKEAGDDRDARVKLSGMLLYLAHQIGALDL